MLEKCRHVAAKPVGASEERTPSIPIGQDLRPERSHGGPYDKDKSIEETTRGSHYLRKLPSTCKVPIFELGGLRRAHRCLKESI